jgi:hypothetical protein
MVRYCRPFAIFFSSWKAVPMRCLRTFFCTFAVLWLPAVAIAGGAPARAVTDQSIVLKVSDLRSACLVRAGVVRYDANSRTTDDLRAQLQRHFNAVIGLLLYSSPQSIELALDRLESSNGEEWSESERLARRQRLLEARWRQILRLAAYRDRGRFPLNEGQSIKPAPIFVDEHDTACAVGHLMRMSGWESAVASIRDENNLVYVPDVASGPIAKWILTSGLTIEEAALVQPSYGFVPRTPEIPDDAINAIASKWAGVVGDLRYSNFKLFQAGSSAPDVNVAVTHNMQQCSFFCSIGTPFVFEPLKPVGEFNATADVQTANQRVLTKASDLIEARSSESEDFSRVLIQFDVETTSPTKLISQRPFAWSLRTHFGQRPTYGRNEVGFFLSDEGTDLLFDHRSSDTGEANAPLTIQRMDLRPFVPTRKMTVVSELLLSEVQPSEAQMLHFDVMTIPEPGGFVLLMLGFAICYARPRGR